MDKKDIAFVFYIYRIIKDQVKYQKCSMQIRPHIVFYIFSKWCEQSIEPYNCIPERKHRPSERCHHSTNCGPPPDVPRINDEVFDGKVNEVDTEAARATKENAEVYTRVNFCKQAIEWKSLPKELHKWMKARFLDIWVTLELRKKRQSLQNLVFYHLIRQTIKFFQHLD